MFSLNCLFGGPSVFNKMPYNVKRIGSIYFGVVLCVRMFLFLLENHGWHLNGLQIETKYTYMTCDFIVSAHLEAVMLATLLCHAN